MRCITLFREHRYIEAGAGEVVFIECPLLYVEGIAPCHLHCLQCSASFEVVIGNTANRGWQTEELQ